MNDNSESNTAVQSIFEPVVIRYDGLDATQHEIDLYEFGKSAQGLSKIITTVASFVVTGNYDPDKRKLDCRVTIRETKANCFSFTAWIQHIGQNPLLVGILSAEAGAIFTPIFIHIWDILTGKDKEMKYLHDALTKAIEQLGRKDDTARLIGIIEKMALGLAPAAKDAVHPIGTTCETIKFGNGKTYYTQLDQEDKEAILKENFEVTEENQYRVLISELDMIRATCKVSLRDDLAVRYNAKITDPQIELADNRYVTAMAHKSIVTVKAKQKVHKGQIKEFVISDIERKAA